MREDQRLRNSIHQLEGGGVALFMIDAFEKHNIPIRDKKILEIGPKHGLHTRIIDQNYPKSITCIDLINKKDVHQSWLPEIRGKIDIIYEDIIRFNTEEKFEIILCSGVIYHNTEQIRILKKLWSLSSEDCYLIVESSTIRDKDLKDKNVIQVHWPETYRGVAGLIFHPSKKALISMLDMSGWEVVESSDEGITPEAVNEERITLLCRRKKDLIITYEGIDHNFI